MEWKTHTPVGRQKLSPISAQPREVLSKDGFSDEMDHHIHVLTSHAWLLRTVKDMSVFHLYPGRGPQEALSLCYWAGNASKVVVYYLPS